MTSLAENTEKLQSEVFKHITVPFHGADLYIVEHHAEPYTPMKPIVEGMGLDWKSQFAKIKDKFATSMVEITMQVTGDIQKRSFICLPVRKLAAWLYSVSPNKVKPELRDTIIMYQNECDDALWEYWTKGHAINPRSERITPEQAGILFDIVANRTGKDGSLRAKMWGNLKRHFKYASYHDLLACHFEEAKIILETMDVKEKIEAYSLDKLEDFIENLSKRYPNLSNPIAYEVAQQIAKSLEYYNPGERLVYWVAINQGKVVVQQYPVHYKPVNVVKLAASYQGLQGFLEGSGLLEAANNLKKLPLGTIVG